MRKPSGQESEVRKSLEEFVKEILYAFPMLETVEEDYQEHIRNKAVLSYKSALSVECLVENIVSEIEEMQRLIWLKAKVGEVLDKLNGLERMMVAVRYFGKKRKVILPKYEPFDKWSERTYFREQERLGNKLCEMLYLAGVTREVFERWFLRTELFNAVHRYAMKVKEVSTREKKWLNADTQQTSVSS